MKRASGNGENKDLGKKKVRFWDGNDHNFVDLDNSEGEEEGVLAPNGVSSEQVDKNGNSTGNGGINLDRTERICAAFGINPLQHKYPCRRRRRWTLLEYDPLMKFRKNLDLVSDDDDDENEMESGMSSYDRVRNLNPDLPYARLGLSSSDVEADWKLIKASCIGDSDSDTASDDSTPSANPPEALAAPRAAAAPEVSDRRLEYRRDVAQQLASENLTDQSSLHCPGPFYDALRMVRERAPKLKGELLIKWEPLKQVQDQTGFIPSLLNLSLKALAENAEGIVSLQHVPDNLRGRLSNRLCDIGKINARFLQHLVEGCPTEIRIKNCSWITDEQFEETLGKCRTNDLRVLQLDLCGQCLLDVQLMKIVNRCSSSFSRLTIVSLRGTCRLSDDGFRNFLMSAPLLRSINLGQCALITSKSVDKIADYLGSNLRELYIDECLEIDTKRMLPAFRKFSYLEVLSVAELGTIDDQFVEVLVRACGQHLKELDFCNCIGLTDYSLKMIGERCTDLRSLNVSKLHNLSDSGLEALANGCRSIQKLKLLNNDFSDEAVAAFLESSGEYLLELFLNRMSKVGPQTAFSIAKCSRKLLSLDMSWCRSISNEALGLIVDSCSYLKQLKIFGCTQINEAFLKGHSNPLVRIIGVNLTTILDHLDLFDPEEVYMQYSPIPI